MRVCAKQQTPGGVCFVAVSSIIVKTVRLPSHVVTVATILAGLTEALAGVFMAQAWPIR
jgi:hypothetical protein